MPSCCYTGFRPLTHLLTAHTQLQKSGGIIRNNFEDKPVLILSLFRVVNRTYVIHAVRYVSAWLKKLHYK